MSACLHVSAHVCAFAKHAVHDFRSGEVEPRPGVLQLMDEARAAGLHVAVCSAATKPSCIFTLKSLLGEQRFSSLDCFLAGVCAAVVGTAALRL